MAKEIIDVESSALIEADSLIRLSEIAEKRVEAVNRLIRAALAITRPGDWVNLGGQPYLCASGAEKIARLFGIGWKDIKMIEEQREDEKGMWYLFTCEGTFFMNDIAIRAIGTSSTRAKFFGWVKGKLKPLDEVDIPSVKKAAYTNCIVNGITRLIGLRKMTWDDLRAAKIDVNKIPKVDYKIAKSEGVETKQVSKPSEGQQTPLKMQNRGEG